MKRLMALLIGGLAMLLLGLGCAAAPAPKPEAATPKAEVATPKPAAATPKAEAPAAKPADAAPKAEAPSAKTEPAPAKLATAKIGTLGAASDAPIYIALDKGYLQQEGLTAEIIPFTGIPQMTPPLSTGEIDVGAGIIAASAFNAIERGVNLKMVAEKSSIRNDKFMYGSVVVRKDLVDSGAVKEPKDLKGRKIGVASVQSGVEAEVAIVLQQAGLTIKDVELVTLGYPDAVAALANKAIDAAWLIEPSQTTALERGIASLWEPGFVQKYSGGVAPGATIVYSEKFVKNVDLGRKFMVAYLRGVRDYLDAFSKGKNKAEIVSILVKNTSMKDPALYDKLRLAYIDPDGKVDVTSAKMVVDYLKKMGYYTGKLDIDQIIDTQFAEYAVQKLGKYQ